MVLKWSIEFYCCSNHLPEQHLQYAYFSKAHRRLSSSGDYKRTQQGALTTLLLYLYKYNMVRATTIFTGLYVHVSISCPITHPPCFYLKATIPCPCALTSYSLISITMCTLCIHYKELLSLDVIPNPNSFLDSSQSFQTLSSFRPLQTIPASIT